MQPNHIEEKREFDNAGRSKSPKPHVWTSSNSSTGLHRGSVRRMSPTSIRYSRYILFAIFCLGVVYFVSTSSIPKYTLPLRDSASQMYKEYKDFTTSKPPTKLKQPQEGLAPPLPIPNDIEDIQICAANNTRERMNATFVSLARNTDIWEIARSIRQVEDRFNKNFHYDWVFLNDKPFDEQFRRITTALASGTTHYGEIQKEHWGYPSWIDQDKARKTREKMAAKKIIYGDSQTYRHMCRFESGFFFQQPLLKKYEWYWRIEPSIEIFCDINYDPFKFLRDNGKKYSFVISLYEYIDTIPTLWDSAKRFMKAHPEHIAKDNAMKFLSDDGGDTYNRCHFWSNFEIASLDWFRSPAYTDYFNSIDREGGFYYERWGDAPVHSVGAGILLNKSEIHFFDDIAYYHVPFTHCPANEQQRVDLKCHCDPKQNFDWRVYSCTDKWFDTVKMMRPEGWHSPIS